MSAPDAKTTARKLADNLAAFYDTYQAASDKLEAEESGASRLGGWFGGGRGIVNDRMHMEFYQAVEKRCALLAKALTATDAAHPGDAHDIAADAVAVILRPVPDQLRDVGGWMRFAAEPLCAPLLQWLSREELTAIRENYVDVYPKRKMFKPQRALLTEMDRLLKEKR